MDEFFDGGIFGNIFIMVGIAGANQYGNIPAGMLDWYICIPLVHLAQRR